jgi:hypothetical protein
VLEVSKLHEINRSGSLLRLNDATAEVKYFLSNARAAPLARVLAVAFRRSAVE